MNRKNLTAAVLAGLAGAAGIVGSAQAVNINPDGLGQVLIYPYYTTNGGNSTLLSVVNTSDEAKAVKVRFLEGENSREVLDFNLYMSAYDVWTASLSLAESETTDLSGNLIFPGKIVPTMVTRDSTCTVPYIYGYGNLPVGDGGSQEFLPWALNDAGYNDNLAPKFKQTKVFDDISRGAEGHFEMIEMGTLLNGKEDNEDWVNDDKYAVCDDDKYGIVHADHPIYGYPDECLVPRNWTSTELKEKATYVPYGSAGAATHDEGIPDDCQQLVDAWTEALVPATSTKSAKNGYWFDEPELDIGDPSGGLFGGAAIVNVQGGAMYSYDAKAIDGFFGDDDVDSDYLHQEPGTILPSLDSGGNAIGIVFVDGKAKSSIGLERGVDAVSYVFMHDQIMNEYTTESAVNAATEWVITFPTKQFYVHQGFLDDYELYRDPSGNGISPYTVPVDPFTSAWTWVDTEYDDEGPDASGNPIWVLDEPGYVDRPCEVVELDKLWDREEQSFASTFTPGAPIPPIVSPAPPDVIDPDEGKIQFELCYETSVIEFGPKTSPDATSILGSTNFHELDNDVLGYEHGWARLNFLDGSRDVNQDGVIKNVFYKFGDTGYPGIKYLEEMVREPLGLFDTGLRGLPVTGFAVQRFENGFLGAGQDVLSNYGGIFQHKGTRKMASRGDYGDS